MFYHIDPVLRESPDTDTDYGINHIYLNATAWADETDAALSNLLKYIHENKSAPDSLIDRIDAEVAAANRDAEWRRKAMGFMTLEMSYNSGITYARKEGRAEGEILGEERNNALIGKLLELNRISDLERCTKDE